ncbi:hypothetical protein Patl1_07619 [Pistacia atlantica]|uniref:Uncharacterized protein n=1 Tax=Pistacia atlantica TaxID=434234 RepID=A0ACC1AL67_9ROSI|nr:hypothetical protein Patl1_07619 [Pistacia atlantica]
MTLSRCAAHPIYEEELVEFDCPTEQCSSSISGNNLIEFHQDFVTSEMDAAATKRSLVEYDGAETSGISEEPQPKRQKNSEFS